MALSSFSVLYAEIVSDNWPVGESTFGGFACHKRL